MSRVALERPMKPWTRSARLRATVVAIAAGCAAGCSPKAGVVAPSYLPEAPIRAPGPAVDCCHTIHYKDGAGNSVYGQVAWVDLTRARPFVPDTRDGSVCGGTAQHVATSTLAAALLRPRSLYINANFFKLPKDVHTATCLESIGLAVSTDLTGPHMISSPGDTINGDGYLPDSLIFYRDRDPEIVDHVPAGDPVTPGMVAAVSGVRIVRDGVNVNTAPGSIHPDGLEPRTAVGVNRDGTVALVVVIEGKPKCGGPGRSDGINLSDLADLMLKFGAYQVLNLDGGGSTAMVYADAQKSVSTMPTDCYPNPPIPDTVAYQYRPVPISLAFGDPFETFPKDFEVFGTPFPMGVSTCVQSAGALSIGGQSSFLLQPWAQVRFSSGDGVAIPRETFFQVAPDALGTPAYIRIGP